MSSKNCWAWVLGVGTLLAVQSGHARVSRYQTLSEAYNTDGPEPQLRPAIEMDIDSLGAKTPYKCVVFADTHPDKAQAFFLFRTEAKIEAAGPLLPEESEPKLAFGFKNPNDKEMKQKLNDYLALFSFEPSQYEQALIINRGPYEKEREARLAVKVAGRYLYLNLKVTSEPEEDHTAYYYGYCYRQK